MQTPPIKSSLNPENIEDTEQLQFATKILIKRCSKCGTFSKLVQDRLPPFRLDAWCDDCFVDTPAIERMRKCSVGQRWLLFQKQEAEEKKKADLVAQVQAEKKVLADKRAKDKKASPTKSRKKTVASAYSLPGFKELTTADTEEEEACNAISAHDARRARIEQTEDKTIFDDDYYD